LSNSISKEFQKECKKLEKYFSIIGDEIKKINSLIGTSKEKRIESN